MRSKKKIDYYNIATLVNDYPNAYYYMVIGERSNGKTYSALRLGIEKYLATGEQIGYIRRFGEDIRPKNLRDLFSGHIANGDVGRMSGGRYNSVNYTSNRFYFGFVDQEGNATYEKEPFCLAFDLAGMEHYKSISFPYIKTIIFDEFLSRQGYLPNEFLLLTNALSTIIRDRNDVKIFMLGNTVNKYSPYFGEMGLTHIKEQKQGSIDVYHYGETDLEVVVEYCQSTSQKGGKSSDVYFAFDNPELQMITTGSWEIGIYPHLEERYAPKDVIFTFFIHFDKDLIHGDIVVNDTQYFVFFHPKTTPIKDEENDIVYTDRPDTRWNYRMALTKQGDKLSRAIQQCLRENRAFYSDNETGEIIRNYLKWSDSYNIKN